jgi:adenylate cyclase
VTDPYRISQLADELLEECERKRWDLKKTFDRLLPAACGWLGASSAVAWTKDEHLEEKAYKWGAGPFPYLNKKVSKVHGGKMWVDRTLDVAGRGVGKIAFGFEGVFPNHEGVTAVCEELDNLLWSRQLSARKQDLLERMGRALTRRTFDQAIDDAVAILREATPFASFALVYVDDAGDNRVLYRIYEGAKCAYSSEGRRHKALDAAIKAEGAKLVEPGRERIAQVLKLENAASASMVAGIMRPRVLGEAVASVRGGIDAFGADVLGLFGTAVTQRLTDFNRERRHLSQFFAAGTIDTLVRDRDYLRRYLSPRVANIAILYADINSFTKICEQALKKPALISSFVDRWSAGVVDLVWKNGGVFDKMVGDCVIAHFGPPFFGESAQERVARCAKTAFEVQAFTKEMAKTPEFAALARKAGLPGLGVAIGLNYCSAAVGIFGPNQDFTAFSRGMNETARLQGQAGFREVLAMESVRKLLPKGKYKSDGPHTAQVKNVGKPLRYFKLTPA